MPNPEEKPEAKPTKILSKEEKEKVDDLNEDIKKVAPLDTLARSAGGKILVEGLVSDIISKIDSLAANYDTWTMQQFVANAASIKEKLDLARAIKRAKDTRTFLEEELQNTLTS